MPKIRILVVDDSVVVRRMVSDALASDPQLEVVGAAANGKIALAKIPQVNPDIVILDVEMPELDGLGTLVGIRKSLPALPVIMYSTLTQRGAEATLEALSRGATDYVTKPSNVGSAAQGLECIRTQLIPKIKAICSRALGIPVPSLLAASVASKTLPPRLASPRREEQINIVAIGVSTGGPNALASLIPSFPRDLPVPVVIVQHMPPVFTRLLAERLAAKSQIGVEEGYPGAVLGPGCAWLAPGDYHMVVASDHQQVTLRTYQGPPENSCRPAADVLFRSVAEVYKPHALAVVMTGMGQDGLRGCEHIRESGGQILAQDQATSVVWGMPGFVANAGLADKVLPLDELGMEILRRVRKGRESTREFKSAPWTVESTIPR
ncbi:MAG: chemotaxis response regulator protein-glutamate methylesterase [Terriglobia bacterium]|jgi:two-component system chemotaxis response regulator CheB